MVPPKSQRYELHRGECMIPLKSQRYDLQRGECMVPPKSRGNLEGEWCPRRANVFSRVNGYRRTVNVQYFRRVNRTTFEGSIVPQKIKHAPRSIISIPQRAVNGTTERALVTSERSEW